MYICLLGNSPEMHVPHTSIIPVLRMMEIASPCMHSGVLITGQLFIAVIFQWLPLQHVGRQILVNPGKTTLQIYQIKAKCLFQYYSFLVRSCPMSKQLGAEYPVGCICQSHVLAGAGCLWATPQQATGSPGHMLHGCPFAVVPGVPPNPAHCIVHLHLASHCCTAHLPVQAYPTTASCVHIPCPSLYHAQGIRLALSSLGHATSHCPAPWGGERSRRQRREGELTDSCCSNKSSSWAGALWQQLNPLQASSWTALL